MQMWRVMQWVMSGCGIFDIVLSDVWAFDLQLPWKKTWVNKENLYFDIFSCIFWDFWLNIKVFGQNNLIVELLRQKWCRIIYKFRQKTIFGPETFEIWPKVVIWSCPDLSRRTSTYCKPAEMLLFFSDFIKSLVLLSKFIIFCKIIGFTK